MQRDEILAILAQHQDALKRFCVKSLAIFGSVARDEARPDSDVDILVEFEGLVHHGGNKATIQNHWNACNISLLTFDF